MLKSICFSKQFLCKSDLTSCNELSKKAKALEYTFTHTLDYYSFFFKVI